MTTTFLLVRHAAHEHVGRYLTGRRPGAPLSGAGRVQAAQLGQLLRAEDFAHVQTSPAERARQTAEAIAGRNAEVVPALDEIDFGEWTGLSFDALAGDPAWRLWNEQRDTARPPGGESMVEARSRILGHMQRLRHSGARSVLLVTHCDMIRAAVTAWLGLPLQAVHRFEIAPASVTTLTADGRILGINERRGDRGENHAAVA